MCVQGSSSFAVLKVGVTPLQFIIGGGPAGKQYPNSATGIYYSEGVVARADADGGWGPKGVAVVSRGIDRVL
jgi:hypothetical protein